MNETEWLIKQRDRALGAYDDASTDLQAYQFAAEAETYERIKNGTLIFGGPKEALETRLELPDDEPDFGMSNGRIRALEKYIERFGD